MQLAPHFGAGLFSKRAMPRKNAKLVAAAERVAVARRLVADQQNLIARLRALNQPTTDAEVLLQNAGIERFDVESFLAPDLVIVLGGPIGVYE